MSLTHVWYRGETRAFVLTVSVGGEAQDLTAAVDIELQLKAAPGDADPPLASMSVGSGITLRPQSGATLGQADIVLPYNWLTGDATPAGLYYYDVVAIFPGPIRRYVVKPTKVIVRAVVNGIEASAPVPIGQAAAQDHTERSFIFTATVTGTTQTVTIPGSGMYDATYSVAAFSLRDPAPGDGAHPDARFPVASRTTTSFTVVTDTDIRAGSTFDVYLRDA